MEKWKQTDKITVYQMQTKLAKILFFYGKIALHPISCMAKCLQQRCLKWNCLEPQLTTPLWMPPNTILFDNLLIRGACRVPSSLTALSSSPSFSPFLIPFLLHNGYPDILAFMSMTSLSSTTSSPSKTSPILSHFSHSRWWPYLLCFEGIPCHVALFVFYLSPPPVVLPLPLESSLLTHPVSPFSHSQIWASLTHHSICSLWIWILLLSCFMCTSGHLSLQQSAFCPRFYSCNGLSFYLHGLSFPLSSESTLRFLAPFPFPDFNLSLNYISSSEGILSLCSHRT